MVDLSALIALLTALASAVPSAPSDSLPSRTAEPPEHCGAVTATGSDAPVTTRPSSPSARSTESGQITTWARPTRQQGRPVATGDDDNAEVLPSPRNARCDDTNASLPPSHRATHTPNPSSRTPATATPTTATPTTATPPRPGTSPEATSESAPACVDQPSDAPATTEAPIADADVPAALPATAGPRSGVARHECE